MTIITSNQVHKSGTALKSARALRKTNKTYFESNVVLETINLLSNTMLETESSEMSSHFKTVALEYMDGFECTIRCKGIVRATTLYKELWNWSKTDALGGTPTPLIFTKTNSKGVPKKLIKLKSFWDKGGFSAISALTITSIHNTVTSGHPPVDLSSITEKKDEYPKDTLDEFRQFVKGCKLTKTLKAIELDTCHDVYASGAQGIFSQAYYSASLERQVVKTLPIKEAMFRINERFHRTWLTRLIKASDVQVKVNVPDVKYIRRLSVVPEKAHKHRIIVISDFWSQNTLLPLHRALMKMLKHIHQDATYQSSEIITRLSQMDKGFRDCIDLKNFTDYLPVSLQCIVLEELFDKQLADDWKDLMIYPVRNKDEFICYSRGQPMGLLSSWAVATITHHYIMWWAGSRIKAQSYDYYLLGDDNVIWDKSLAESYEKLLVELDIPQSEQKRLTTFDTGGLEFCKRLLRDGKEITPIPWNVMNLPKVERYLDLYRLVNMRIDKLSHMDVFLAATFPNPLSELDRVALETYIELIRSGTSPQSGVSDLNPKSLNPSLQAKITKAAINLADLVDNANEIIDFDPRKSNVRFTRSVVSKRIRNVVDPSVYIIFKIITLRYLQDLEKNLGDWEYRFKKIAGNGAIYAGGRIDWNLANIKDRKEVQFYKLEPSLRFSTKRSNVRHATLKHIKNFITRSTDIHPEDKGSLLNIEKDLGAFIYRKCLHESLADLLKYKGDTVSCHNLIDKIRKEIIKISPDIEHHSVNPSLITVDYGYDSDIDEFGG